MKKIVLSLVVIVVVILGIIFLSGNKNGQKSSYYPDSEGWSRKALQGDEFESLFPLALKKNLYLVSPTEKGVFDSNTPTTLNLAFIEYRNKTQINLGTQERPKPFTIVNARRTFYALKGFEEMPVFKMWTENLSTKDFPEYTKAVIAELDGFRSSTNIEKQSYNGHDYYVYLRKDLSTNGLRGKNSIGGAYVFFPEKNTVLYIFLFNTRYNTPTAYLISNSEIKNIIQDIIDSASR